MVKERLNYLVKECRSWIIEHRRDIHQYPEPSRREYRTSKKIYNTLQDLGLDRVERGYYETGVAGIINGSEPGKTIGLRFDMDALEMEEKTGLSYASREAGCMHACGHDGHVAIGLGVARVLNQLKNEFAGNIKLIFQPAEEDAPNGGGARYMIQEGILEDPVVDAAVGLHIWPDLLSGQVGTRPGILTGSSDVFTITVNGKGSHASQPFKSKDPIVIGAQIVSSLQTIISRNIDPFEQVVLSIGIFQGGTRYNIIPHQVTIKGTVRTYKEEIRKEVSQRITMISENTARALGGEAEVDYIFGHPPVVNDPGMVDCAIKTVKNMLGEENAILLSRPAPIGEDFAYFAREVESVYLCLGSRQEGQKISNLHSPYFTFDEEILPLGVKIMAMIAINWLAKKGGLE